MKYTSLFGILVLLVMLSQPSLASCSNVLSESGIPLCSDVNFFFWNATGDVGGYHTLNNVPEPTIQKKITSAPFNVGDGEIVLGSWLTPAGLPCEKILAPGLWRFRVYSYSSSSAGDTVLRFYAINRTSAGVETLLFYGNAITIPINQGDVPSEYLLSYARRNYTQFFHGDRLAIRVTAATTSAAARTVTMEVAGNTNATMVYISQWECPEYLSDVYVNSPPHGLPLSYPIIIGAVTIGVAVAGCFRYKRKLQ